MIWLTIEIVSMIFLLSTGFRALWRVAFHRSPAIRPEPPLPLLALHIHHVTHHSHATHQPH